MSNYTSIKKIKPLLFLTISHTNVNVVLFRNNHHLFSQFSLSANHFSVYYSGPSYSIQSDYHEYDNNIIFAYYVYLYSLKSTKSSSVITFLKSQSFHNISNTNLTVDACNNIIIPITIQPIVSSNILLPNKHITQMENDNDITISIGVIYTRDNSLYKLSSAQYQLVKSSLEYMIHNTTLFPFKVNVYYEWSNSLIDVREATKVLINSHHPVEIIIGGSIESEKDDIMYVINNMHEEERPYLFYTGMIYKPACDSHLFISSPSVNQYITSLLQFSSIISNKFIYIFSINKDDSNSVYSQLSELFDSLSLSYVNHKYEKIDDHIKSIKKECEYPINCMIIIVPINNNQMNVEITEELINENITLMTNVNILHFDDDILLNNDFSLEELEGQYFITSYYFPFLSEANNLPFYYKPFLDFKHENNEFDSYILPTTFLSVLYVALGISYSNSNNMSYISNSLYRESLAYLHNTVYLERSHSTAMSFYLVQIQNKERVIINELTSPLIPNPYSPLDSNNWKMVCQFEYVYDKWNDDFILHFIFFVMNFKRSLESSLKLLLPLQLFIDEENLNLRNERYQFIYIGSDKSDIYIEELIRKYKPISIIGCIDERECYTKVSKIAEKTKTIFFYPDTLYENKCFEWIIHSGLHYPSYINYLLDYIDGLSYSNVIVMQNRKYINILYSII